MIGLEAALCNGVYGSEGNQSSALLAREVCAIHVSMVCALFFHRSGSESELSARLLPIYHRELLLQRDRELDDAALGRVLANGRAAGKLNRVLLVKVIFSEKFSSVFLPPGFKFCFSSSTPSCSCWGSVKEARQEFQQRCMNSSSPGETFPKLLYSVIFYMYFT